MTLSPAEIDVYRAEGWIAPLDVLSADEVAEVRSEYLDAEQRFADHLHATDRNNAHLVLPFLADLARDRRIVDAAAALLGDDLTLSSTVLFIKEPATQAFVSWHQDAYYMGLAPDDFVTAWLALTPSTPESGCVTVIPGTHRSGARTHDDRFGEDNILTRGQTVEGVDERNAVDLVLEPGQMSLHHPWLVHGSRPNTSSERRIGVAFQSYLGPSVRPRQSHHRHHVMHVRGAAVTDPFLEAPAPTGTFDERGIAARTAANRALSDVLYDGARTRRSL